MENLLDKVNKIVVKVGTAGVTTDSDINREVIANIAKGCYELREQDRYVTIVTSGAIAAGKRQLKDFNEGSLVEKQVYAAVGQPLLMQEYTKQFRKYGMNIAQFLVSKSDFLETGVFAGFESLNNCYYTTLLRDIVPIFNENDTVATSEIRFSDNDELEALIAVKLRQDLMINLVVHDGLIKDGKVVELATSYNDWDYDSMEEEVTEGRGGLMGKLEAVEKANKGGKICIIGNVKSSLLGLIEGKVLQTRFYPK